MVNYRFRLSSGATLDLQCGDRPNLVAIRVIADPAGTPGRREPVILFYQQRPDPAGYQALQSGDGIGALAADYMARQAHRFGRVGAVVTADAAGSGPSSPASGRVRSRPTGWAFGKTRV